MCSAEVRPARRTGFWPRVWAVLAPISINKGHFGVMVAARGDDTEPVPLEQVAGKLNLVPPDHSWVQAARRVATCLGD